MRRDDCGLSAIDGMLATWLPAQEAFLCEAADACLISNGNQVATPEGR